MDTRWPATLIRRLAGPLAALGLALLAAKPAASQPTLTFPAGSPALMRINAAVAGSAPTPRTNNSTTYRTRTTAGNPKKITAQLSGNMPAGVTLTINLTAIAGAVAVGTVTLNNTAQTVLNNITNTTNQTGAITYTLSATAAAGVMTSATRTVTFTLVAYP
jgi:hypothetical protein